MATLSNELRSEISLTYQQEISALFELLAGVTKSDIKAAVDAVDQWVDDNKVSFNSALPTAAQTNLTVSQKSRLLTHVVARRFQEGE